MPQIQTGENGKSPVRVQTKENMPFRLRLRKRYKTTDYVKVINIDSQPFYWQYFPTDGEEEYFQDNGATRIVDGRQHYDAKYEELLPGNDQAWEMEPGVSEVLIGSNADLFIEGLYRTVKAKRTIKSMRVKEGQARKFNFGDGLTQEAIIDEIFLGVAEPEFKVASTATTGANSGSAVTAAAGK